MANKKNKVIKRRLIVFGSISVLAIVYFVANLINFSISINSLKEQKKDLSEQLENLKKESEDLKIEIEKLKDPEYIARFAREEFSYSKKDGEYIIKIEEKEQEEIIKPIEKKNNYQYFIGAIALGFIGIIIYIIKK